MPERIDTTETRGDQSAFATFGLTKREVFAAMAMQGLLAGNPSLTMPAYQQTAEVAVQAADALITALNVKEPPRG